jgi:rubrerythrin
MQQNTPLGLNRTGIQMSPIGSAAMQEATANTPPAVGDGSSYVDVRQAYADEADALGSVPVPGTLSGVAHSGVDMITGKRPQVLIDKLSERLAFERGGVRLYDALLVKCGAPDSPLSNDDIAQLRQFRDEEAEHMALVAEALADIGADPTAQTPCADLVGVESMGLVQAMNDPRTNVLQALHVMLDAELVDNTAWQMLIELARASGHDKIAEKFLIAEQQEAVHLARVRGLLSELTFKDAGLSARAAAVAH